MGKFLLLLLGLLATFLLAWLCARAHAPAIESDLGKRTGVALRNAEFGSTSVAVDGRDVVLTGVVATEALRAQAGEIASNTWGVFTVDNRITVAAPPEPKPQPAAEPLPEPEPMPEAASISCQNEFNRALAAEKIQFASSSATIDAASFALLDNLVDVSAQCPDARFEVAGHTDSSGSEQLNQKLSQARASSVVDYLTSKGVDAGRLTAVGYGENKPIADNNTVSGKAKNRRIEFNVQGI